MTADGKTRLLQDYGNTPGAFQLTLCHSWFGEAISGVDDKDNANAPCLCDAPRPDLASHWNAPNNWTLAYTERAVEDGSFWGLDSYGDMCLNHHSCEKRGDWKTLINLTEDQKPAKNMEHAWGACEHK